MLRAKRSLSSIGSLCQERLGKDDGWLSTNPPAIGGIAQSCVWISSWVQIYLFTHRHTYSLTHVFNPLFPSFLTYLCILRTVTEKLRWARWSAWPLGIKWCTQSHLSSPRWTEDWWKSGSQLSQGIRKTALLAINFCSLQALQTQSSCKKWKAHLVPLTLLLVGRSVISTPDAWGPQLKVLVVRQQAETPSSPRHHFWTSWIKSAFAFLSNKRMVRDLLPG